MKTQKQGGSDAAKLSVQTPLFLPTPLRRNTCAEKIPTKLMMSSSIASGQKTKAPVTKMGLTYWFLR
jgi:hypothetical protein